MIRSLIAGLSATSPFLLSPAVHSGSALVFLRLPTLSAAAGFSMRIQVDPANPTFLGDYPKFALWNDRGSPAQNAYFLTMNLFC